MPLAPRRPDTERQEWLSDTSNNGKPSGNLALEVAFDNDDPRGEWTTHLYGMDRPDLRLSRGQNTAIVIEGVSHARERELNALIHRSLEGDGSRVARDRILELLNGDDKLRWAA